MSKENRSIKGFLKALDQEAFVEAHELLEDEWRAYKSKQMRSEAKAVQGLINGATALALLVQKQRPHAYKKVWPVFLKYEALLETAKLHPKALYLEAQELLHKKNIKYQKTL